MALPRAYKPEEGQMYQILVKCPDTREFEHCDYAKDRKERDYLVKEYALAYGAGFTFRVIKLPNKYWKGN